MPLQPLSQEKLNDMKIVPPGTYDFEVFKAEEGESKKGAPMVTVDLKVFKEDGSTAFVRDWLVNMDNYMCQQKIRSFCDSCGITEVSDEVTGASGKVALQVRQDEQYGTQNTVLGYVTPDGSEQPRKPAKSPQKATAAPEAVAEDDCPF